MCTLWDNYICGSIQTYYDNQTIEVVAYNMGVPEPGVPFEVSKTMLDKTMLAIPDKPSNFSITVLNNSVVDLQWYHPWKTGNHLKYFYIQIYLTSTNFQKLCEEDDLLKTRGLPTTVKLSVTNYTRYYSKRLYLFPSTRYIVSIQAVTYANKFSETMYKTFKTPSTLTFNGHLEYMLYDSIYTISLNIPPVLNNTQNSMMHIIVKGPQETKSCETHSKIPEDLQAYVGIDANDVAWQAAELPTLELAGKPFIVGNNLSYGNAKNCPLRSKEFYEITVIITEHNQNVHNKPNMLKISIFNATESSTEHKKWLIFIILIFVVPGAAFYFYQRYVFYLML
ncbi:hypothetical protein DMN91_005883 [Ooceraea biroi]|uniref:Tyrosine-protein phosphatase 10D n=1 Tax=Ooceraea biroi TaxID=2015173 RepID=A0A3L8DM48_OOCBI|nr:hypothetical protein DMN91_005883 [Ooceraea biroi]